GGPGHCPMCEGGELFPTRKPVDAPRFPEKRIEAPLDDETSFPGARACRGQGGGEPISVALRRGEARPQDAALEQPATQLAGRATPAGRPELQHHRQVLVDLPLRLQLELRNLSPLPRALSDIEEVRHALGRGAKPHESFLRPRIRDGPRELRQDRVIEKERDVELLAVLAQEQRLVRAGARRVPFAERTVDEEVAHRRGLHTVDRLKELLELRKPAQRLHCTNPRRGTTPWLTNMPASRSLPVFSQRS